MSTLVVMESPSDCPLCFAGVTPVAARDYLSETRYQSLKGVRVYNLSRSYRYQSLGYYVSLVAEARRHKAVPSITTIQDMKSVGLIRLASSELEEPMAKAFAAEKPGKASIIAHFGWAREKRFEDLADLLFKYFPAPFLRADFAHQGQQGGSWQLVNVSPLSLWDIPEAERAFAEETAAAYFAGKRLVIPKRTTTRYDLAVLHDPKEADPPSDSRALKRLAKAAQSMNIGVELITKDDSRRLQEFDALFIRETTSVDHHTYRMARKAVAEGLVVIDDPLSILRCSNKVFLAELLGRNRIPTPKTKVLHAKNLDGTLEELSLPIILKQPDSAFSKGVMQARGKDAFMAEAKRLLKLSDLVIAQEFVPTDFDWRVGVLDGRPLFACRYHMAGGHWQIAHRSQTGKVVYGKVEPVPIEEVPPAVLRTAIRAAGLVGDGLYGVDLKQIGRRVLVIEVNDNPNIDAGYEDAILGDDLYRRIMAVFLDRITQTKKGCVLA